MTLADVQLHAYCGYVAAPTAGVDTAAFFHDDDEVEGEKEGGHDQRQRSVVATGEVVGAASRVALPPQLPEDRGKLTVVLDLDETLIRTVPIHPVTGLPVVTGAASAFLSQAACTTIPEGNQRQSPHFDVHVGAAALRVHVRPGLEEFLRAAAERFELIVFTAGAEWYASAILDRLDPDRRVFRHRLFRQHCQMVSRNVYVKDLNIVNRPLARTVLVDNTVMSFLPQLRNGVPISSFFGDARDTALYTLADFLALMERYADVRCLLDDVFALEHVLGGFLKQNGDARPSSFPPPIMAHVY